MNQESRPSEWRTATRIRALHTELGLPQQNQNIVIVLKERSIKARLNHWNWTFDPRSEVNRTRAHAQSQHVP